MTSNRKNMFNFLSLRFLPVIMLFFLALVDFDINVYSKKFASINLIYIIIYYLILKKPEIISYGVIFFLGVINDVVIGLPIGISSIDYLLLCGIASYFRNMTLRSALIYEWLSFLPTILIITSIHYSVLNIFFNLPLNYQYLLIGSAFTFVTFPLVALLFNILIYRSSSLNKND